MKRLLLCIVVFVCAIGLVACNKSTDDQSVTGDGSVTEDDSLLNVYNDEGDTLYKPNKLDFTCEEYILDTSFYYDNGFLYYVSQVEETPVYKIHRYSVTEKKDEELFEYKFEANGDQLNIGINKLSVNDSGNIVFYHLYGFFHNDDQKFYREIEKYEYDCDGNKINSVKLESNEKVSIGLRCFEDKDGNSYVSTTDDMSPKRRLFRYNADGKLTGEISNIEQFTFGFMDNTGKVILTENCNNGTEFGYADFEAKSIDKKPFSIVNENGINADFTSEYENKLLILGMDALYTYVVDKGVLSKVMEFRKNDITRNDIMYATQIDEQNYLMFSRSNESYDLTLFEKRPDNEASQKSIRMVSIYEDDGSLEGAVNAYNKEDHEYRIDYVSYGMNNTEPSIEMTRDIVSGNIPDIFITERMNMDNLVEKNLLEDLTPYIKKDDTLNNDYFIDGYLDAASIDGSIFGLTKRIKIDALAASGHELGSYKNGWTLNDFITYCQTKPDDTYLFGDSTSYNIFQLMFSANTDKYIDWKTGECSFDKEDFEKLLEFCYSHRKNNIDNEVLSNVEKYLKDGKILFNAEPIYTMQDFQINSLIFDKDVAYIGYPSDNGNKYDITSACSTFAMSSGSENKEVVWEIIKEFMTGDYLKYRHDQERGLPVSKKEFNEMIKEVTTTKKYTAEDGTEIQPQSILNANINLMIGPATEEDVSLLKSIIKNSKVKYRNNTIIDVIGDDILEYFEGNRDIKDTVKVIQDKMIKYVNENI